VDRATCGRGGITPPGVGRGQDGGTAPRSRGWMHDRHRPPRPGANRPAGRRHAFARPGPDRPAGRRRAPWSHQADAPVPAPARARHPGRPAAPAGVVERHPAGRVRSGRGFRSRVRHDRRAVLPRRVEAPAARLRIHGPHRRAALHAVLRVPDGDLRRRVPRPVQPLRPAHVLHRAVRGAVARTVREAPHELGRPAADPPGGLDAQVAAELVDPHGVGRRQPALLALPAARRGGLPARRGLHRGRRSPAGTRRPSSGSAPSGCCR
jgi:hypothetical protein